MKLQINGHLYQARLVKAVEGKKGDYYLTEKAVLYRGKERKKFFMKDLDKDIKVFRGKKDKD